MRIAVAGGTGLVGRYVVTELIDAGHDPVVLSRTQGVDLASGTGLDQVLKDAQVLIDVSNVATLSRKRSEEFFAAGTRNLQEAGPGLACGTTSCPRSWRTGSIPATTRASAVRRSWRWPARSRPACCGPPSSTSSPSK